MGHWRPLLRQRHADCEAESSDMLLYLAGVNEHAAFRIIGSKRWSVAHFLKTIQYLLEYGVRFLQLDASVRALTAYAAGKKRNYFSFADDRSAVMDTSKGKGDYNRQHAG
jgi:hypothetical protein